MLLAGKPWGDVVEGEYWGGCEVIEAHNCLAYGYGDSPDGALPHKQQDVNIDNGSEYSEK